MDCFAFFLDNISDTKWYIETRGWKCDVGSTSDVCVGSLFLRLYHFSEASAYAAELTTFDMSKLSCSSESPKSNLTISAMILCCNGNVSGILCGKKLPGAPS
ncbi:hypothetical protein WICPIJ_006818 [Wickerhamomyces pijperi]|uniref:Uncharacterized protein n=1 Tax=Wickerhamomyces pijperi TaxID=599730 RepID=A0A9P8Q328_WICPI|nr:hypothetical protein WICPIJ_006818 [Wickerhamomyces pijperi]